MLKDETKIKIQSGRGGNGSMGMFKDQASGGDGGKGGDVYVIGKENIYDLSWFDFGHTYKALKADDGHKRRKSGADGKDMILQVPLTTDVYVNDHLYTTIDKHNQKVMLLKGGKGSLGNISLKKISADGYFEEIKNDVGDGKNADVRLVYKMQADAMFLGYPNAGKSSMLNELTNAVAKTAGYAFTTLEPQLGMLDGYILMDLPGLIAGTHAGKGLGTRFVKHTEIPRLLIHMVSLENENIWEIYSTLRKELELISAQLAAKPELVVLTKTDEVDDKTLKKAIATFKKHKIKVETVSIIDDDAIENLKKAIKEKLATIDA